MTPKEVEDVVAWRCHITGNPVGTDARVIGAEQCGCQGCRAAAVVKGLKEERDTLKNEAASLLRTQAERIVELERERDEWRNKANDIDHDLVTPILWSDRYVEALGDRDEQRQRAETAEAQLSTAQATIERYREALEEIRDEKDSHGMKSDFPAEIARTVLSSLTEQTDGGEG